MKNNLTNMEIEIKKNKERFRKNLTALIVVIFFLVAYKCSGQKYPERPMQFETEDNEKVYISVLKEPAQTSIVAYFNKDQSTPYTLKIGFVDNYQIVLKPVMVKKILCYQLDDRALLRLKTIKFDSIIFESPGTMFGSINVSSKDYFINFLRT